MNIIIALATAATINTTPPDVVPLNPPASQVPYALQPKKKFMARHPRIATATRFVNSCTKLGAEVAQILLYIRPRK